MARNNNKLFIIGMAIFGVLALGFTVVTLMGKGGTTGPPPQPTPTIALVDSMVANRNIPPRTLLDPSMFTITKVDPSKVPLNAITSRNAVAGKISTALIKQGQPLTAMLVTDDSLRRVVLAGMGIPMGFRAVAIWVDPNQTAAGLVDVGDRVDVIVDHKLTIEKGPNEYVVGAVSFTSGRTIAQNLEVLAVDKSISAPPPTPTPKPDAPPPADGSAAPTPTPPPPSGPPTPVPTRTRVLLAASPTDAERLVAAGNEGTLHITIRNPGDLSTKPNTTESREYPSTVIRKFPQGAKAAKPDVFPTFGPVPTVVPADPNKDIVFTQPTPSAPEGKEVTIIRGTEKTRVIVPPSTGR